MHGETKLTSYDTFHHFTQKNDALAKSNQEEDYIQQRNRLSKFFANPEVHIFIGRVRKLIYNHDLCKT